MAGGLGGSIAFAAPCVAFSLYRSHPTATHSHLILSSHAGVTIPDMCDSSLRVRTED